MDPASTSTVFQSMRRYASRSVMHPPTMTSTAPSIAVRPIGIAPLAKSATHRSITRDEVAILRLFRGAGFVPSPATQASAIPAGRRARSRCVTG